MVESCIFWQKNAVDFVESQEAQQIKSHENMSDEVIMYSLVLFIHFSYYLIIIIIGFDSILDRTECWKE